MSTYVTVAIPYVNADPHLGYAFELVDADLAVRARRARGESVRFLGGTDEYSLKNVLAAGAVGVPTRRFVDDHADRFEALASPLGVRFDDFIRTSRDPRHRPAVERLWQACREAGDLYVRDYEGRYCLGCEQFYDDADLVDGCCPEHGTRADSVSENNWFFRLSRYGDRLIEAIERDDLQIEPEPFRNEVLAFLHLGLRDISVSRSAARARGWGIPVPNDPGQIVYVWFDALANYISALGFGTDADDYDRWWRDSDDRVHVIGKGILRFHAVYWPAFLLSAGQPLPTRIHVHPYLTVDGEKLSKSVGVNASPTELCEQFGTDAVRWWCASDVSATSDTDFTTDRLVDRANLDLANGLGNAVSRLAALVVKHRGGAIPSTDATVLPSANGLAKAVADALADFDRRTATSRIVDAIAAVNRHLEDTAPWRLAGDPDRARDFDRVIDTCVRTLHEIADAIEPITSDLASRIRAQLDLNGYNTAAAPVFPRLG